MQLNAQSIKKLDRALKVINQRIAEYGKENQFGRDSNIYKQTVGQFETKDLERFIGTSKSGDFKFKRSAIIKELSKPGSHPELEKILNVAGYREGKPGYLRQTKEGKLIKTVTELKKEWKETLDPTGNLTDRQLKDEIEMAIDYADDFKSLVYEYQDTYGEDVAKEKFPKLYGKGRGRLSKADYNKIRSGMIRELINTKMEERKSARTFVDSFANR